MNNFVENSITDSTPDLNLDSTPVITKKTTSETTSETTSVFTKEFKSFGAVELQSKKALEFVSQLDILAQGGKFFSVSFRKASGELRDMVARVGVTKDLKGGSRALPLKYLCVYDVQKKGYRSINPETIEKINSEAVV